MSYMIIPNYYAPKHPSYQNGPLLHAVVYNRCSFRCKYCIFPLAKHNMPFEEYDLSDFAKRIDLLSNDGNRFKITGGEPTLDPMLLDRLELIKDSGGTVFLDTNGSRPNVLKKSISQGFVDVVGISLKGTTKRECMSISGVKDPRLSWDNVFQSIKLCSENRIPCLVTAVCFSDFSFSNLDALLKLLESYPDVYLKLNAWIPYPELSSFGKQPPSNGQIESIVKDYLKKHPECRSRFVIIPSFDAVSDKSAIIWE